MVTLELIDTAHFDRDDIEDVYGDWGDDFKNNLEIRFNKIRKFNETLNESTDDDTIDITEIAKDRFNRDTIELIANQICNRLTLSFDNTRKSLGIRKGEPIVKPIRNYDSFKLSDDRTLTYVDKRMVIDFCNISEGLIAPWDMHKLGVKRLKLMGFLNITDEDVNPYKLKYKRRREEKLKKLDENLDEKANKSDHLADYLDLTLIIDSGGKLSTRLYDKRDDFDFHIVNFPYLSCNIPSSLSYGVYISQLIRYA